MMINNFTEFYNTLKHNDAITNTIGGLKDYVLLVESYKDMCSCNRKAEKIRLKMECENQYKLLVTSSVANNINVFFTVLNQPNITFVHNNAVIRSFTR
jgi:hypothetical protein